MAQYGVSLHRTDSFYVEVEADSEEEALDWAYAEAPYLCAMCSGMGHSFVGGVDAGDWYEPEDGSAVELLSGDDSDPE